MNAHVPPDHRLTSPIGVYAIPIAPAASDDRALARIYDELAEYLDTVYHHPDHDELRNLAALHGWTARTPFAATRWQNRHGRQVILLVADHIPPRVEHCDHGRVRIAARRPFQGALRHPAAPDAHRHYTEIRICQSCDGIQLVNVGLCGAREPSSWFAAPPGQTLSWPEIHRIAVSASTHGYDTPRPETSQPPSDT